MKPLTDFEWERLLEKATHKGVLTTPMGKSLGLIAREDPVPEITGGLKAADAEVAP